MEEELANAETGSELTEPHFDDEATLLSARRVVPLDEVPSYESQTTSRFARGWLFAATVVGALLLGVVTSAAYYSYLNRTSAQTFVDIENIAGGIEGISTEQRPASTNTPQVNNTAPPDSNPEVTLNEGPASASPPPVSTNESKKPTARRVDVLTSSSAPEEVQAREERQARKEARKRIRELERESRVRRSPNDLTRIREIFEGPQKP